MTRRSARDLAPARCGPGPPSGRRRRPGTAAEPGKDPPRGPAHGMRSAGLRLPPLYYGTVDATPLWVCCCTTRGGGLAGRRRHRAAAGLDGALELDGRLRRDPRRLLRYDDDRHGLSNQGWKDSGDAMRRHDGTVAAGPIALVETQAYAVAAARRGARCSSGMGANGTAGGLGRRARGARFATASGSDDGTAATWPWRSTGGEPGRRRGQQHGPRPRHRPAVGGGTARVVERLLRPDMLRPFGIGTLSSENPAYNPLGYHTGSVWTHDTAIFAFGLARAGHTEEAASSPSDWCASAKRADTGFPSCAAANPSGGARCRIRRLPTSGVGRSCRCRRPRPHRLTRRAPRWAVPDTAGSSTLVTAATGSLTGIHGHALSRLRPPARACLARSTSRVKSRRVWSCRSSHCQRSGSRTTTSGGRVRHRSCSTRALQGSRSALPEVPDVPRRPCCTWC